MNTSLSTKAADWLAAATSRLKSAGIPSARLDCLLLLQDQTKLARIKLVSDSSAITLTSAQLKALEHKLTRRAQHVPMAYIRHRTEFYGQEFYIDKRVLVPRPESEAFLEILKTLPVNSGDILADLGCGSGALGISAKLLFPETKVDLIDISRTALFVAEKNLQKFGLSARTLKADLLAANPTRYRILLANLPYVPNGHKLNPAAEHEPRRAIYGGPDGLALYRRLVNQLGEKKHLPNYLLIESFVSQQPSLEKLFTPLGYRLISRNGLVQAFTNL